MRKEKPVPKAAAVEERFVARVKVLGQVGGNKAPLNQLFLRWLGEHETLCLEPEVVFLEGDRSVLVVTFGVSARKGTTMSTYTALQVIKSAIKGLESRAQMQYRSLMRCAEEA